MACGCNKKSVKDRKSIVNRVKSKVAKRPMPLVTIRKKTSSNKDKK